jgi:hypothetical protein
LTPAQPSDDARRDLLSRPLPAILLWGLPLAAGWTADATLRPAQLADAIWAVALAWMGAGCTLNARRCHRLHCYLAAPILFLGAAATAVVAFGFAPFGPHSASLLINGSLALALLTFLAEPVWGRYRRWFRT